MSEAATSLREFTFTPPRPEAWIGAASPLWAYFTGAAMLGVSWWWATRWMQAPARAEVRLAEAARTAATTPVIAALRAEPLPQPPVGGEAAPVSPAAALPDALVTQAEPEKPSRKPRSETEPRPH